MLRFSDCSLCRSRDGRLEAALTSQRPEDIKFIYKHCFTHAPTNTREHSTVSPVVIWHHSTSNFIYLFLIRSCDAINTNSVQHNQPARDCASDWRQSSIDGWQVAHAPSEVDRRHIKSEYPLRQRWNRRTSANEGFELGLGVWGVLKLLMLHRYNSDDCHVTWTVVNLSFNEKMQKAVWNATIVRRPKFLDLFGTCRGIPVVIFILFCLIVWEQFFEQIQCEFLLSKNDFTTRRFPNRWRDFTQETAKRREIALCGWSRHSLTISLHSNSSFWLTARLTTTSGIPVEISRIITSASLASRSVEDSVDLRARSSCVVWWRGRITATPGVAHIRPTAHRLMQLTWTSIR